MRHTQEAPPTKAATQQHIGTRWLLLTLLPGLLAALLAAGALAQPWSTHIDIGDIYDSPYLWDFHGSEFDSAQQVSFRWSQPQATIMLPGAGREATARLRLHSEQAGSPLALDAGAGTTSIALRQGWQQLALLLRPDGWSGDILLQLDTPTRPTSEDDPRARGLAFDSVALSAPAGWPPPGQVFYIGLSTALASLLTGWALRRVWAGVLVGGALALAFAWLLTLDGGFWRLAVTAYTGRLLLVLLLGGGLALALERLLALLQRRGILPMGSERTAARTRRSLAAAGLLAFVLRFAALAYPLNHNSDLPFILGRTWLVRSGQFLTLFLPNPALTPVQWDYDITIPRSPFYYVLTTPVTLLPGRFGDELGMMAFSSMVDALAVLLVAVLVLYAGGSGRAATMAALLAGTLPFGLLVIVSWGIFPTLLAQCLSLLVLVLWLNLRPHLHQRRAWLLLAGSLVLAFLAYPTALLFLGTTGALLLLLLALRRDPAALPTFSAALVALLVVVVLYYGWHVPAFINKTLPTVSGELAGDIQSDEPTLTLQRTLDALRVQPLDKFGPLVLGLAGGGALLLALRRAGPRAHDTRLLLLAWCAAFVPFALADEYIVTFILKHLVHLLPALAVLGGLLLGRLAQRRAGMLVCGALLALVLWQGVLLELDVIVNAFAHLK